MGSRARKGDSLNVEDGTSGVRSSLVLGRISYQSLLVGKGDV
jgi:hypothetical protein